MEDNYINSRRISRTSITNIDEVIEENAAYRYLCHLEEARLWIQECIQVKLPHSTELEAVLRNGVYLAKLGNFIAPHVVPLKKIFDADQKIYNSSGLHYRHTDNINYWILAMKSIGLPSYFYPNAFDVYGKKNMPKVIYCLHALNLYLHRCFKGMKIIDLIGKIKFSSEEINSVSREFKKFGIQLPSFSKINGILSKEIAPDTAVHAAIIAVNIAVGDKNCENLLEALMNPNALFENVLKENAEKYQMALSELKSRRLSEMKSEYFSNKCKLSWDFLTQKVIQEEIDSVNLMTVIDYIKNAVLNHDINHFMHYLQSPILNITDIVKENAQAYFSKFKGVFCNGQRDFLNLLDIQSFISLINHDQENNYKLNSALNSLNKAILSDDIFSTFNILKSLVTDIDLYDFGSQFYHSNFKSLRHLKGHDLDFEDVQKNLPVFNALLDISLAVIQGNKNNTYRALSNSVIKSWELNPSLIKHYFNALSEIKHRCLDILSVDLVKNCITDVNTRFQFEENLNYVENINFSLSIRDEQLLIDSLLEDPLLLCVNPKHKTLYVKLLLDHQHEKNNNFLLRSEIQNQINRANDLVLEAEYYCACLVNINIAIDKNDETVLFDSLKILCKQESICSGCKGKYLNQLSSKRVAKYNDCPFRLDVYKSSWVRWDVFQEAIYYLNLKTLESAWNLDYLSTSILDKNDILEAVTTVNKECLCQKYESLETLIISFQSFIRGYLARQKTASQGKMLSAASYTSLHDRAVVKLQSFVRMSLVRKKYISHRADQLRLNAAARIIQRQWRAFKVTQNLNILAYSSKPPLSLLRNIIYMLETSNEDYSEEFKLHMIKGKVVQTIRYNQTLLKEISEMDVKIGLLIRNRMNLEELLKQKKKSGLKRKNEASLTEIKNQSCKFFSKKYNLLIESYENLLYLLQTQPVYLSRLIVSLPANQATSLIESIVFSLYNFGSTPREEYLLLKLLSLTLQEDIKEKGDDLNDIIKGENIIMKIIISFYRKTYWRDCLKSLLQPLVLEILNDKSALYTMDPVEIYKLWLNELEMETGIKSLLPYEITADEALCHSEVNYRINLFIDSLLNHSLKLCEAIINGHKMIPYGIMFISKVLKSSLKQKYSSSSEEELNKIVGNFLYYRYINPAIIAPDIFDIITTECNENLADCERIKLSIISKFLYLCVTGQKYGEDMSHLMCLNPYISDCHEKFMEFFSDVCKVKEPEEHFNIDVFSEAIFQIPEIYLSLSELQTLYKLVSEKEYDLAPDSDDVLHEILEDFDTSLFESIDPMDDFLNTEVCLSLKSKYDLEVEEAADEEKMFAETKFMLITLLQVFSDVNDVTELYEKEYTPEEEMQFEKLYMMKKRVADSWIRKTQNFETLQALQAALRFNLNSLELAGYITSTNNYQDILNDIAKDIVNRWRYRISRKKEIARLQDVQKQLNTKTFFYLEKLDYYNNYMAACLENMKVGKQNKKFFRENIALNEVKHKKTVKCSGSKLHEKGILVEIKDIDIRQLKNVYFEISPSEDLGIFMVKTKFMNFSVDTVDIDIQELLSMQYQGIAEMYVLDSVKININLLLYFLNSKFYGKSR